MVLARLFNRAGCSTRLVALYPASSEPVGQRFDRETVAFGRVRWRNCAVVIVSADGLYIQAKPPVVGAQPAMIIPWDVITAVEPAGLVGRSAVVLTVGEPGVGTVGISSRVFAAIRDSLCSPG